MFHKFHLLKRFTLSKSSQTRLPSLSNSLSHLPKANFSIFSAHKRKYLFNLHTSVFRSVSSIHSIYHNNYKEDLSLLTGVSREDLTLYKKTIDRYLSCEDFKLLTEDEKHTIIPLFQQLAYAHHNDNNEESSFRYLLETQQLCENTDLKDSFHAAQNNYMLAIIYAGRMQYEKAEICIQEVKRIALLLTTHPEVANIYVNCLSLLGKVYSQQEKLDEALEMFNLVLGQTEKILEGQLPGFLMSVYQEMALIYSHRKDFEKALECNKKGLEIMLNNSHSEEEIYYQDSPESFYGNIAANLSVLNRPSEALPYAKKAVQIAQKTFAKDSLELAGAYDLLARVYHILNEFPKALEFYKKAKKIYTKDAEINAKELCVIYLEIMEIYRAMGEYQNATNLFNKEIKVFIEKRLEDERSIAVLYSEFGHILKENQETFQESEKYYQEALKLYNKLEDSPAILDLHYILSELAFTRQDFNKALGHLKEYERVRPEDDLDYRRYESVCGFIGEICYKKGDYDESLEYCKKALEVCEAQEEDEQKLLSSHCANLGRVYEKKGMLEEALQSYQRGLIGGQKNVNVNNESMKAVAARVVWLASKLKKPVQAEILYGIFSDKKEWLLY